VEVGSDARQLVSLGGLATCCNCSSADVWTFSVSLCARGCISLNTRRVGSSGGGCASGSGGGSGRHRHRLSLLWLDVAPPPTLVI
jgi:hypothetical protein